MNHREKVDCFLAEMQARDVPLSLAAPPIFRLFWRIGLRVPPPFFLQRDKLALIHGLPPGLGFFLAMQLSGILAGDPGLGLIMGVASGAVAVIAGVRGAWQARRTARQLGLGSWSDYSDTLHCASVRLQESALAASSERQDDEARGGCTIWSSLVSELEGAEYYRGLVTPQTRPFRVQFEIGLADVEVEGLERRHGIRFPEDLRAFLQTALPTGPGFPDWRGDSWPSPCAWMEWVKDGILFDVEHNGFWLEEWQARPPSVEEAREVATRFIVAAPPLIPVFAHRMLPTEPSMAGNPVFSLHQTDVIYYGCDLEDYFRHEFELGGRREWPPEIRPIPFWSRLL